MADRNRPGFTLVELLVVVVIISMLVGLLLPAVIGARARARQTQCSNNQRELALAVQQYETAKNHLPGYINNFGPSVNSRNLSWVVVLLPHLGREDLWTEWRNPTVTYQNKRRNSMVDVPQLRCPTDSRTGPGVLSYVANCGIQAGTSTTQDAAGNPVPENVAHGVFHDRSVANPITAQSDRIPDGASNTLLLSESLQATEWGPPQIDPTSPASPWTGLVAATGPDWREAHVGMVWTLSPGPCRGVNKCKDAIVDLYDSTTTPPTPLNPPTLKPPYASTNFIEVARPCSNHVDGVVVTYCDGHQGFFFEDTTEGNLNNYGVYRRLMAPDDGRAGVP